MNGIDAMNPQLEREAVDVVPATEAEIEAKAGRSCAPTDDSSPDPLSPTDRYRLSMPYSERI